jgi:hypothetical protein
VVEVSRFTTRDTEVKLISWAQGVSCGAIRHRGDLVGAPVPPEAAEVDQARTLSWWYLDEGRRFGALRGASRRSGGSGGQGPGPAGR